MKLTCVQLFPVTMSRQTGVANQHVIAKIEVDEVKLAALTAGVQWTFGTDLTSVVDLTPSGRPTAQSQS